MATVNSNNATLSVYTEGLTCGSGYGTYKYAGTYKGECGLEKRHYYALKKIFPITYLSGDLDDDLEIEGYYLDRCEESGWELNDEMFPETTNKLISQWEELYDIDVDPTDTIEERRNAVLAAHRSTGGLSVSYFEDLASDLGYSITIEEDFDYRFIVASTSPPATKIPAQLYDETSSWAWTWRVNVSGVTSAPKLEEKFYELAPAHTKLEFQYV